MKNKIIAIITARGGSKRIPRKNIKNFLGKPIIAYSIEAAFKSGLFNEIMVSTDDREIAEVAKKYGAEVPFMRSKKNSDDFATTADVVEEVLLKYKKQGEEYDYAFCIYPTAPFITAEKLKNAFKILKNSDADAVVPVCRFSYPIQRGLKINTDGRIAMLWPRNRNSRSQDLIPTYHDAGQYSGIKVRNFLAEKKTFTKNTVPIVIPELEVQDLDNEEDWRLAEIKFKILRKLK